MLYLNCLGRVVLEAAFCIRYVILSYPSTSALPRQQSGSRLAGFLFRGTMARQYPICITREQVLELPWKEEDPAKLYGISGVYMVVDSETNTVLYVGQSNNIGNRLKAIDHPCRHTEDKVLYLPVEDLDERGVMERTYIVVFTPPLNRRNGSLNKKRVEVSPDEIYTTIYEEYLKEWHASVFGR